jgi:ABC-2 type transport system permease protein
MIGKILRFFLMFYFLYVLVSHTKTLAGYNLNEVIFFYATFNLVDQIPQLFLREVYRFRSYVVQGYLDHILTKPVSPLFRSLFGGSDILDLSVVCLSLGYLFYSGFQLTGVTFFGILLYIALVINALIIAFAFHIFVLGFGIITTEIDNSIMLYRDTTRMGQFPVDVYRAPVNFLITFVLPVGIMMTFPVKALLGTLDWQFILIAFAFSLSFLFCSLKFWEYSLKQYQSASS